MRVRSKYNQDFSTVRNSGGQLITDLILRVFTDLILCVRGIEMDRAMGPKLPNLGASAALNPKRLENGWLLALRGRGWEREGKCNCVT